MESKYNPGFYPAGHRVLVWPIETDAKTESGIIIAQSAKERDDMAQIEAMVVAVGAGAYVDTQNREGKRISHCAEGDKVLIAKYAGIVKDGKDGKKYRLINDLDVIGVMSHE